MLLRREKGKRGINHLKGIGYPGKGRRHDVDRFIDIAHCLAEGGQRLHDYLRRVYDCGCQHGTYLSYRLCKIRNLHVGWEREGFRKWGLCLCLKVFSRYVRRLFLILAYGFILYSHRRIARSSNGDSCRINCV